MIGPALRTVLLGIVTFLVIQGEMRAHVPEKLVIDLRLQEDSWEATSEMDVKFAVVALMHHYLPPDTGSGWIGNLNSGQLGLVKDLTEKLYRERFQFLIADEPVALSMRFPDYESTPVEFDLGENEEPVVRVVMSGRYPAERGAMTVKWNARWGPTLALLVRRPGQESPSVVLAGLGETVELGAEQGGEFEGISGPSGWPGWVGLGFERFLIRGPLHLLFVVGLLLLVRKSTSLFAQILCFTLAHSLAFWLVILRPFEMPSGIVPTFLALGLIYIGIENLFLKEASSWRLGMVSGLGLVHGLGFANVMQELPISREEALLPLAGFHLGIELAQVVVIGLAFVLAALLLKFHLLAKVRVLGSVAIVSIGFSGRSSNSSDQLLGRWHGIEIEPLDRSPQIVLR